MEDEDFFEDETEDLTEFEIPDSARAELGKRLVDWYNSEPSVKDRSPNRQVMMANRLTSFAKNVKVTLDEDEGLRLDSDSSYDRDTLVMLRYGDRFFAGHPHLADFIFGIVDVEE